MNLISVISGSALGAFLFKVIEKFIDEYLANRRISTTDKRALADEVVRLCAEAKKADFNTKPREYENVLYISHKVKLIDEKIGKLMEDLARTWMLCSQLQSGEEDLGFADEKELLSVCHKLQEVAEQNCEKLITMVAKWKR